MGLVSLLLESLDFTHLPIWQSTLVYLGLFIGGACLINVIQQIFFKDPTKPPVVFHFFPFFGSTVVYGMQPYDFFFYCQKKYGDVFTFVLLGRKMTVCLGPEGNDFVFNGKLADVNAELAYTNLTTPVFGTDVCYDVPNHILMEQKKFIKFGLTTETFKQYVSLIVSEVNDYFAHSPNFGTAEKTTGSTNAIEAMSELIIYTASRTLQGKEVRSAFDSTYAQLYHDLDKGFNPVNFLLPNLPLPVNRRRDMAQRKIANSFMAIIKERRKQEKPHEKDMIWNLMNQKYKDGRSLNDKEIAHIMIALLMAGQHTSSTTSAWAILRLAEQPDLIERLYEEQKQVCGENLRDLEYEDIAKCSLLNYVIKETLRMHPPLHSIIRKVMRPLPVPGTEYVIPASHYIMAAPGVSAVDSQYFPDPTTFKPDRWQYEKSEDEAEKFDYGYGLITKGGNSPYLPFGAGRHRCIGEQFAYVQNGAIIATFVRNLKWRLPDGQECVPEVDYTSMVAQPKRPATFVWEKR